jgi:nicotinamide phosphoribosyltransferase
MINQFSKPGAIYAVVSDSYDIYNAVDTLWGKELRDKIISTGGTLVIRPDSADLVVLPKLIISLEKSFGATVNDKGYKVLNNVRLLWGDGINFMSISSIMGMIVDVLGYSADNIAFGMGGALHMGVNRDTYGFAMKASAAYVNGEWVDVFKDPITDPGKKSKRGRFDDPRLKLRYRDGTLDNVQKFDEIRANAK